MSLVNLGLYCLQQFGMTLGVGAETILLVAYLQSVRDGIVDDKESGFARAVGGVKDFGLALIITSGAGIVALQFLNGQLNEFLSIVVFFKWSLIGIVLFMTFITRGPSLAAGLLQGLSAGTWYALFAVHILAPAAPWEQLAMFYAVWLVGFSICWTALVFALRNRRPLAAVATRPTSAISKAAVIITPDRVIEKPAPKPAQDRPSGSGEPRPGLASVSAIVKPPHQNLAGASITTVMPQINPEMRATGHESSSLPAQAGPKEQARQDLPKASIIPVVPKPPAPPTPPPPPPPPAPPPPPVSSPKAPPPAEWLHVMPRTPEELAKRKAQTP